METEEYEEEVVEEDELFEDDPLAWLDAEFAEIDAKTEKAKAEFVGAEETSDTAPTPAPAPVPEPEPEPEPVVEAPKPKSGLEFLMSGGV